MQRRRNLDREETRRGPDGKSAWRTLAAVGVAVLVAVNGVAGAESEAAAAGKPTTEPKYVLVYVCAWGPPDTASVWYQGAEDCNLISGVLEKPVVANWAKERDDEYLRSPHVPADDMTGALVESWELTDDLTLVLHLREGVYWHDKAPVNGREFTVSDLEFFLKMLFGLDDGECKAGPKWCSVRVDTVSHTTNPTVTLHLGHPSFFELGDMLDSRRLFIYPPELLRQADGTFVWQDLVGTGPFMLADYQPGMSITWHKNPNYWGFDEKHENRRLPYVDEVRALIIPDPEVRKSLFLDGKIDYLGIAGTSVPSDSDELTGFSRELNDIVFWDTWVGSVHTYGVNVNSPPLDALEVRAALQMALDLETINETLFDGRANWTPHGQVGDFLTDYYTPFDEWPDEVQGRYIYDPDGAKALLEEAGYSLGDDEIRFKITLQQPENIDNRYAEIAMSYWREIGIIVDFEAVDRSSFNAMRESASWDGLASTIAAVQSFDERLATQWEGGAPYNPAAVDDPEMNKLIAELRRAKQDQAVDEYRSLFRKIDQYAIDQHWAIWGPAAPRLRVTQPWVKGYNGEYHLGRGNTNALFARLWIDR